MFCISCGTEVPARARICARCGILVVLSFVALAVWGFFAVLAGQKIFKEELFD